MNSRGATHTHPCKRSENRTVTQSGPRRSGLISNHPELVALWECLETHQDHENLMYFTDSETTLLVINKWTGGGVKLNLVKTVDTDILRTIVIKLQKRIQSKSKTLLIKVKVNRGYPLNEETDIRAEMGRMKEEQEKTWSVYDRKQVKSNPTKHTRRGRKSGGRSTYQGKEKETSPKKGRNHWKTKTYGGTKQTYSR